MGFEDAPSEVPKLYNLIIYYLISQQFSYQWHHKNIEWYSKSSIITPNSHTLISRQRFMWSRREYNTLHRIRCHFNRKQSSRGNLFLFIISYFFVWFIYIVYCLGYSRKVPYRGNINDSTNTIWVVWVHFSSHTPICKISSNQLAQYCQV